jgi:hypothetical protein
MSNLADLTKDELITYIQSILNVLNGIDGLVGDVPVSEQLGAALERMALKDHMHDNYVTRNEIEEIKQKIEKLFDLVGDTTVSEQINAAININK